MTFLPAAFLFLWLFFWVGCWLLLLNCLGRFLVCNWSHDFVDSGFNAHCSDSSQPATHSALDGMIDDFFVQFDSRQMMTSKTLETKINPNNPFD